MKPSTLHLGGLFLGLAGIIMQIAGASSAVPGPVGFYSGITAQVLGFLLHSLNTPSATK